MPQISDLPGDAALFNHFWFARILYFNCENQTAHIQWLEHGSHIILKEFAHPQELFLTPLCENQNITWIAGKISVVYSLDQKHKQYFIRYVFFDTIFHWV
jgi:DNA (cytosine-5)-methyltransferase 1